MSVAQTVRAGAGLPDDDESDRRADAELGNALSGIVQLYLARERDQWDVDLFFETYGRPPRDGSSWAAAIIGALEFRTDIPETDRLDLISRAEQKAIASLTAA
jgi:hypothetical protein